MVIFHSYVNVDQRVHPELFLIEKVTLLGSESTANPPLIHRESRVAPKQKNEVISSPGQLSFMKVYEFMMLYIYI